MNVPKDKKICNNHAWTSWFLPAHFFIFLRTCYCVVGGSAPDWLLQNVVFYAKTLKWGLTRHWTCFVAFFGNVALSVNKILLWKFCSLSLSYSETKVNTLSFIVWFENMTKYRCKFYYFLKLIQYVTCWHLTGVNVSVKTFLGHFELNQQLLLQHLHLALVFPYVGYACSFVMQKHQGGYCRKTRSVINNIKQHTRKHMKILCTIVSDFLNFHEYYKNIQFS